MFIALFTKQFLMLLFTVIVVKYQYINRNIVVRLFSLVEEGNCYPN